ncbi:MAG TPA: ABC-2 family transporter protein [Candidatus Bathyarchaeia archaeon]|nr:ABC-2 family transporter protein [Candidatus Bathyarchaeia archaeon]
MKRYFSLYFHFFTNCLMRDLEFRFNVLTWALMNFLWFGLIFYSIELIFGQVEKIVGWTKGEVLLLVCVQALFFDFFNTFVMANLRRFSRLVRQGELDFALLKPINSRFLVSARYFEFDHYPRMVFLMFLIARYLADFQIRLSLINWFNFFLLFFSGIFIFYNLFFIFATTNIWFIRIFNLSDLFTETIEVGRFPVYIFKTGARFFFTYIIPAAFVATFPVEVLLKRAGFEKLPVALVICLVMFIVSQKFWQFALKHYQSASS